MRRPRLPAPPPTPDELDWEIRLLAAMANLRRAVGIKDPNVTFLTNRNIDPRTHLAVLYRHRGWGMKNTAPLIVNGVPLPYARQGGKHG